MSKIVVQFDTFLTEKLGIDNVPIEADNINEVLMKLKTQFGSILENELYEDGKIKDYFIFVLNKKIIDLKNLEKAEGSNGDILYILPVIAGG